MSKWEYDGKDGDNFFFLKFCGHPISTIDSNPTVGVMADVLTESVQGRNQLAMGNPHTSHRRWFPAVFNFGGELIQVRSIFPFDNFFALSCKVLDGNHDSQAMRAAVEAVNTRAGV